MGKGARVRFDLHPKQQLALYSQATDLLYGGAAGGGKSHLARAAAIIWAASIPGLQVFIFRKTCDDLIKNHMEGSTGFRQMLHPWTSNGLARIVENEVRFHFNGSKIFLCHCQYENDKSKYLGYEMHVLFLEEASQFSESVQRFLCHRVRMPTDMQEALPEQYKGLFPRIIRTSNPGGAGHDYLRTQFVHARPPLVIERATADEGGRLRQFIPAHLSDNPSLSEEEYRGALMQLGDPELVRAMLEGDWDAILGSYFGGVWYKWKKRGGIVQPFALPDSWVRARSFDWGSARPFSVGWWAVANGEQSEDPEAPFIPRGAVVRYREWYGASKPNVGLDLSPQEVAQGILDRQQRNEEALIKYSVADPAIFSNSKRDWGVDIAEEMRKRGVNWTAADNKRVAGWQQMKQRMQGEDNVPMLYVFDTCTDFIRTLPVLPRDEADWEDIDTSSEDHCADEARYYCNSRPWYRAPKKVEPIKDITNITVKELFAYEDKERGRQKRRAIR